MNPSDPSDPIMLTRAFWRRSVRTAALLAAGAIGIAGGYLLATPDGPNRPLLWMLAGSATVVALGLLLLPWERLIGRGLARPIMAGWLALMSAIIAVACALDGGFGSPLHALFYVVILYAATHLPPATVRSIGVLVGAMIVLTGTTTGTATVAGAVVLLGVPGLLLLVSTMISETFQRQTRLLQEQAVRLDGLARIDALTGCLNHRGFHDQLEQHLQDRRLGGNVAVALLDVDHFKRVNDQHGHPTGDEVLALVARALRSAVRADDRVARTGGEEFGVILAGIDVAAARAVLDRARAAVNDATAARGVPVTASVGLAFASGVTVTPDALVRRADQALYRAKREGRDRLVVADAGASDTVRIDDPNADDLRRVLAKGQVTAVFQPIVDLEHGAITAYEALGRIHGSSASPDRWLELAESLGRRGELEVAFWQAALDAWGERTGVSLFLNASPDALGDPAMIALRDRLPAGAVIEVSERWAVTSYLDFAAILRQWADTGVRIAIDDVGAGHANLRHVLELEPDFVKLDRSLVTGLDQHPRRETLVRALQQFASAAGIALIAEGVEEVGEAVVLRRAQVRLAQGYAFARPGPLPPVEPHVPAATAAES